MITNHENKLVYVNPAWERIYGFTSEEALNATPRILRAESHDREFYKKMWADILSPEKGYWRGELVNKTKEGESVPVLLTITPFKETCGNVTGYMGIAVDIREEKKLQAQVMHQDRLASIGVLASGLAHEIGTPLGTIRGRAELMSFSGEATSSIRDGLKIIMSQIDRVSKLIDSLLRIARSKQSVELRRIHLYPALSDLRELMLQKAKKARVDLSFECPEDISVLAERGRLDQVLINLCINAIQAIQEKQNFTSDSSKNKLEFLVTDHSKYVQIEIRDTGCGIAKKNMDSLFKPFFTTKDIGEGTGLGLAIVAKILDEMNASIQVKSAVGEGTSFFVQFKK